MISEINKYKGQLGARLERDPKGIYLFWKARVAFYAVLKSMGVSAGDEVILPAYTCVVVPNAILYLGAEPIYVDIDPDTYNMDISRLREAITDRTKVIVCQNTYGLAPELDEIISIANELGLYTVEDSAHGMGGRYKGRPNGLVADATFFSTQWNKAFSTGIGGFAVANSKQLQRKLAVIENEASRPSFWDVTNLRVLYFVRKYLINNLTYYWLIKVYRFLSSHNLIVGSSNGKEISSIQQPKKYLQSFSALQAKKGIENLAKLDLALLERREAAEKYATFFRERSKGFVDPGRFKEHTFLKYPILVKDRDLFMSLAESAQVQIGDWFKSPLHPVEKNLQLWGFKPEKFPVATRVAKHVVNLSTELNQVSRTLKFLEANIHLVESSMADINDVTIEILEKAAEPELFVVDENH